VEHGDATIARRSAVWRRPDGVVRRRVGVGRCLPISPPRTRAGAAYQNASNLTRAFEEHVIRAIKAVDQTLLYVRAAYARDPAHFDMAQWSPPGLLLADFMAQLSIIDENGKRLRSSVEPAVSVEDDAARDYFLAQKDSVRDELIIGKPIQDPASGRWAIPMTRYVAAPDGTFAGVVVAWLDPNYLSRVYGSVDVGGKGVILLVGTDAIVRARAVLDNANLGQSLRGAGLMEHFRQKPIGNYASVAVIDGVKRLFSYRQVAGLPLIIEVGFAEEEVLETYRRDRMTYFATAALLSLLIGTVTILVTRRQVRLQQMRDALSQSRENLARAQRVAKIGSFDRDLITNAVRWSDQLYRLYGFEPGQGAENVDAVLARMHPEDRCKFFAGREAALEGRSSTATDYRLMGPNGVERVLHREAYAIFDAAGRPVRLFGTVQDITERKRTEEALREARDHADRAARAKSDFLATMSHEIRTPMNAIIGIVEQLQDTALDADQQQMADMVHRSAASLRGIVNDILDISKIEAVAITIAPETIELQRFIYSVCETLSHEAAQKKLAFATEIKSEVPRRILADPMRLRQILVNLVSNAVKFTPQGSVRLTVSVEQEASTPMVAFAISDTGIGMSADVVTRLFTPFMQADASTTRDFGGTGLGLSISRQLAELMGGNLGVTSRESAGSVFTLRLPLVAVAEGSAPAAKATRAGEYPSFVGASVVIAEDLATNRWLLQRQLERFGFAVTAVENGDAAVAALAADDFDLLITDLHMPKMDGVALTRHLREGEARDGRRRLPILGVTADVTGKSRARCLAAGMDGVVVKPIHMKALGMAIRGLVEPQPEEPEAPTRAAGTPAVFDDSTYRELFDESDADGRRWLTDYMESAEPMLKALRARAEDGDHARFAEIAHKLASMSLVAGAMQLGEHCRNIEELSSGLCKDALLQHAAAAEAAYAMARADIIRRTAQTNEAVS
jgi:PAS domain S-box-containing protein